MILKPSKRSTLGKVGLGAAFLMANSSIGPGFLTQTTVFTKDLLLNFGFVILISVMIDLGAQLNTWRVLTITNLRAQDLGNKLFPGLGSIVSVLVVIGGFAFNIGNIAGCGLAINVITGLSFQQGALISAGVAILLFAMREIGNMLDGLTRFLGIVKIALTLFIAFRAHPPLASAAYHTVIPDKISWIAIVTIVGGTVGGYLTFSGAHRLIDAGISGPQNLKNVMNSAISGIAISALMRFILFLATVGVLLQGFSLDENNPAATVFQKAAGELGLKIFGIVLWSAAISSVVGASYTSVSFIKTFHPFLKKYERWLIFLFIILSAIIFIVLGKPKQLLLFAGAINGLILPFTLAIVLIAARKKRIMGEHKHPIWLQLSGWAVVGLMGWMGYQVIASSFFK